TIVANVFPGSEGTQTVAVGVGGNESDPNPTNNVASTTVNVTGGVDLQLLGNTSPVPATTDSTLTYTLVVSNKSGNQADNVTLSDTLPAGLINVTATPATPASQVCFVTTTVTCQLGSLAAGATTGVTIVGTAPAAASTLTNNATVTATEAQTN